MSILKMPTSIYGLTEPGWQNQEIPPHTQEAIENYLIRGYEPGGFVTAVLCNDLFSATGKADHVNRANLWCIVTWIANNAPSASFGDYERMRNWLDDRDGCRTAFAETITKKAMWETLKDEQ